MISQKILYKILIHDISQILVFNTLLPTKARMLLSKSISKDVTNCYKVKITFFFFFLKRGLQFLPFSSKTNLAYKVATEIGTLVFKTSDFKNKRRYLFAQSVQFFMFGFSNSNLTKDRYTYTIYMGSAFR